MPIPRPVQSVDSPRSWSWNVMSACLEAAKVEVRLVDTNFPLNSRSAI